MAEKEFHGAFVFRYQGYGILSSTYLNIDQLKPHPETALLKENKSEEDNFLGSFETIWLEETTKAVIEIELKINLHAAQQGVYNLKWTGRKENGQLKFEGIGMLEKDLLVGCYWKVH